MYMYKEFIQLNSKKIKFFFFNVNNFPKKKYR